MFKGADPEQLESVAARLVDTMSRIDGLVTDLDHAIRSTDWEGPDADGARSRWFGGQRQQLDGTARRVEAIVSQLRGEAQQQRETSAASTGAPGSLPVAGTGGPSAGADTTAPSADGSDDGALERLAALLAGMGLAQGAIATVLDIAKDLVEGGKFNEVLEFLSTPGLGSFVEAAGKVLDVGSSIVDLIQDFADHPDLPLDERIIHAATEVAIGIGVSAGAEAAGTALGGLVGSVVPVGGTLVGAAVGKAVGWVIGEAIEWGYDQVDGSYDVTEKAADLVVDSYQFAKDHVDDVAQVIDGAVDVVKDGAGAVAHAVDSAVDAVVDTAGDVVGAAVDGAKNVAGGIAHRLGF